MMMLITHCILFRNPVYEAEVSRVGKITESVVRNAWVVRQSNNRQNPLYVAKVVKEH